MLDQPLGFHAKAPVSAWNQRLGVDYPGVFKALAKTAVAYFSGNAAGAVTAAIDGIAAFKLEATLSPSELAWHLIRRALARAMAELTVEALKSLNQDPNDPQGLVARLDRTLDQAAIWIDQDFFLRPASLPIVKAAQPPFGEWLASIGLNAPRVDSVMRRLPAYFTFALHREWASEPTLYAPIDAELKEADTPFARAYARERAWLRNAAYLRRLVQQPVFGETFGLEQVYVPLRAWFGERLAARPMRCRGDQGEAEDQNERRVVVDLDLHLTEWLEAWDPKDAVRMICSGPGSGKTSFAKMWAAVLAGQDHRVLYVPLHRLDFHGDLQRALAGFLADWNVLPHDPLDPNEGERRLLILFDGLDELAMQGRTGLEVSREFVEAVCRRVERVNEQGGHCIKIVLGGRDIVVQAAERSFEGRQILHILPYHGTDAASFADERKLLEANEYACDRWWRQFGAATGDGYTRLPEPLAREDLADITAQPLLNYLLALSYRQGRGDFSNLNLVYDDLLGSVYERKWGRGKHPTVKVLRREDFDALLNELALAAWHGTGTARTITETEVQRACARAELTTQLGIFKEGARDGAVSLLVAFYFHQAGSIQGERTFEFSHKSFGEYLTARRLVRWIDDIHQDRALNRQNRQRGKTEEQALEIWVEVTGPTALDHDLLTFLEREVALRGPELAGGWQKTLADLFSDQLQHGLPMHRLRPLTYHDMTQQARNAEEALIATLFCCASAIEEPSLIRWPTWLTLRDLLARLDQNYRASLARECLSWLGAHDDSYPHELFWANLRAAYLEGASLVRANLERANLEGAHLEGADLGWANLTGANLGRAYLIEANLKGAILDGADLGWADLIGANLRAAYLVEANLGWANLGGASLGRAYLQGANLGGAILDGADLGRANLVGVRGLDKVRLDKVRSWRGARIERKWVERLGLDAENLGLEVVDDVDDDRPPQLS